MKSPLMRWALLISATLTVALTTAGPAHATIVPVSTDFSGTSTNIQLADNNGNIYRCPTASAAGRSAADGRSLSVSLTFSRSATVTCTGSTGLGTFSLTVTCEGRLTITSTGSTRGLSATTSIALDSGFRCSIEHTGIPIIGSCTTTIAGPQGPFVNAGTWTQLDQRLRVNTGTVLSITSNCPGSGARINFTGDYRITPAFSIA